MQRKSPKNVFLLLSCKFLQAQKMFLYNKKKMFFLRIVLEGLRNIFLMLI